MEKQRRLRTWLVNVINSGKVEGLEWINAEKSMFKIPWKHESRNDWQPSHAQIFTEWARFTGKFVEGRDKPDFKMFKTRLRCAFNKAPDIEEVPDMRKYKGINPYRVYRLLKSDRKMPGPTPKVKPVSGTVEALRAKLKAEQSAVPPHVESLSEKMPDLDEQQEAAHKSLLKDEKYPVGYTTAAATGSVAEDSRKLLALQNVPVHFQQHQDQQQPQNQLSQQQNHFSHQQNQDQGPFEQQQCSTPKSVSSQTEPKEQALVLLQSTRYRGTLLKNLHNLQKEGILCDLLLKSSGGQVIPVHANVMCASSPFFKEKVDHWEVGHSGDTLGSCMTIEFDKIPFDILNNIIQFIYVGEFEVARGALPIVSGAASQMKLDDLIILCEHVLKALRANGSMLDDKSGRPILPKQPPLMGFPTAVSKLQPSASVASHVSGGVRVGPGTMTNHVLAPGTVASMGHEPVPGTVTSVSTAPAKWTPQKNVTQDDWHIPVGKGRLASSNNGRTQNPLDVLCQAVDETIRTESQSDSDQDKPVLVIDESSKQSRAEEDMANGSESVYSPPALTIEVPRLPMTIKLPPMTQLQPSAITELPEKQAPSKLPSSLLSAPAVKDTAVPQTSPSATTLTVPLPDPITILPHMSSAISEAVHATAPASLSAVSKVLTMNSPEVMKSVSKISKMEEETHFGERYQCTVCNKSLAGKSSLQAHMNKHAVGGQDVKTTKRSSSADKNTDRASDDVIQSIIKRIKTRVPENEQTSSRGAARKVRSRSEAGTESSPIIIVPDTKRASRPAARAAASSARARSFSRNKATRSDFTLPAYQISNSLPATLGSPVVDNDVGMVTTQPEEGTKKMPCPSTAEMSGHECEGCSDRFPDPTVLSRHRRKCPNLIYKHMCDECGKPFKTSSLLEAHLAWHSNMKELTCKECQKVCKSTLLLKLHAEMHASGKFRFRCSCCSKSFLTKKKLEKHIKEHIKKQKRTPKISSNSKCRFCDKEFTEKEIYVDHMKTHAKSLNLSEQGLIMLHPDTIAEKVYFNTASNEATNSESILQRLNTPPLQIARDSGSPDVQIIDDPKGEEYRCLICDEVCGDNVKRIVHTTKHFKPHTDPNKMICQSCLRAVDRWDMEHHECVHAASRRPHMLDCPTCSANFDNEVELNSHFSEEHPDEAPPSEPMNQSAPSTPVTSEEEYKCHKCLQVLPTRDELTQHLFTHYTAKGRGPLVCPVCNRMFTTKYATYEFKRHMCSHTGEKPIPCRFCEKKFKDYSGRSQHEKRVHNRGPLARGRRKGYKMDRDQLYTPPQSQHYIDDASESQTARNGEKVESDCGDKAPPPLMSLSALPDKMRRKLAEGRSEGDSSDGSEDLSLITAVKGMNPQPRSEIVLQENDIKPPPMYPSNIPVNVVRPALATCTSAATPKTQGPGKPFPVTATSAYITPMPHGAQNVHMRPRFLDQQAKAPVELLNDMAAAARSALGPHGGGGPSVMPSQGPPHHVVVAQLSDSGVPLVTMERSAAPGMHVALSPLSAPMATPARPHMLAEHTAASFEPRHVLIQNHPGMMSTQPILQPPGVVARLPFPPVSQTPSMQMRPMEARNVPVNIPICGPHINHIAHQRGYLDAKSILENHQALVNMNANRPNCLAENNQHLRFESSISNGSA